MAVWGVLVAAGHSRRMQSVGNKMWILMHGKPVMAWAIQRFALHPRMTGGVVAVQEKDLERVARLLQDLGVSHWRVVAGGRERHESVQLGLNALQTAAKAEDIVLVHDAARCLLPQDVLDRVIESCEAEGSAIPTMPVTDTVKESKSPGIVGRTVPRDGLFLAQTPQGSRYGPLRDAYRQWTGKIPTDDSEVLEQAGYLVRYVPGDRMNQKLTSPEDLAWFEWAQIGRAHV